ncbi:hypothetical protein CEXT_520731 [Caerostris extrusa]|uniref:Uncharacterized protein n=1 Tax=Caerostris extrusa TaxID=172846 RepID=A0AAV4M9X5_CAEEX|nr:hypothetical protein CEXT_520731 [Caerostris extrusa]
MLLQRFRLNAEKCLHLSANHRKITGNSWKNDFLSSEATLLLESLGIDDKPIGLLKWEKLPQPPLPQRMEIIRYKLVHSVTEIAQKEFFTIQRRKTTFD